MEVFQTMDVKPPMVISLAKKEELVFIQARSEPVRLARNNAGLKLLQYIRDEAHRFAQHYHHILRRKSQLEEDVKQGRRPPRQRKPRAKTDENQVDANAAPHTTLPSLPVLQPADPQASAPEPENLIDDQDSEI